MPTPTPPTPHPLRAVLPATTAMVLVGSAVVASAPLTSAPLFAAQAVRYGLAAALLLALARPFRQVLRRPRGAEWRWIGLGAGSGLVAYNAALVVGTRHADPAALGTAVAAVPILLALLGPLTARRSGTTGRRPSGRVVLGAVVVSAGAALVAGGGRTDPVGVACAVVMLLGETAFTVCGARVVGRLGAWTYSTATTVVAALGCGVVGLTGERETLPQLGAPGPLLACAWLALATAAAFVLWFRSVDQLGSAVTGLLAGVAGPAATLIALAAGASAPPVAVWVGLGVVLAGLAVGLRRRPTRVSAARGSGRAARASTARRRS
ncbi:DMT family transporter [Nakamurella flava]|uniref:DMT family transporter n=1 Tax=Nakamurella flava TaxID=2576308 RepID=A0A4U6QA66_9ACTN|nr:DMT family transporter [Nakamurella flava]TKV56799.1 DMT family transporter [Nakamurella flava]